MKITNILKTMMAGFSMEHSAENMSRSQKQICIKEAAVHKLDASNSITENTVVDNAIDLNAIVLNQG